MIRRSPRRVHDESTTTKKASSTGPQGDDGWAAVCRTGKAGPSNIFMTFAIHAGRILRGGNLSVGRNSLFGDQFADQGNRDKPQPSMHSKYVVIK